MSGQKIAGCCVHVATVIYYLSYAKYFINKVPADHLNSIFVDISKREQANSPRYVRYTRNETIPSSSESESDEESGLTDKDDLPNNGTFSENMPFSSEIQNQNNQSLVTNEISIDEIEKRVPYWGANIWYRGQKKKVFVSNTCTIDYYLFAFWLQNKILPDFISKIPNINKCSLIVRIIEQIDMIKWNEAKEIWVNEVMQLMEEPKKNSISLFGSEYERCLKYLSEFQIHRLLQQCQTSCSNHETVIIQNESDNLFFKKEKRNVFLYNGFLGLCNNCHKRITCKISFKYQPNFIFIQSAFGKITVNELPEVVTIDDRNYKLLCATVHKRGHFYGIFKINNNLYLMNDIDKSLNKIQNQNENLTRHNIFFHKLFTSSSLYYLE